MPEGASVLACSSLDAFLVQETGDRLHEISVPTLVLAGGLDTTSRPELCRAVADAITGAEFEVLEEDRTSPSPGVAGRVERPRYSFWRDVEGLSSTKGGIS